MLLSPNTILLLRSRKDLRPPVAGTHGSEWDRRSSGPPLFVPPAAPTASGHPFYMLHTMKYLFLPRCYYYYYYYCYHLYNCYHCYNHYHNYYHYTTSNATDVVKYLRYKKMSLSLPTGGAHATITILKLLLIIKFFLKNKEVLHTA